MKCWPLLLLTATATVSAATLLEQRLDEIIRTAPVVGAGSIGIEIVQLRSGKVLYARNPEKLFIPASNTKLFSTSLALTRLGADHRFQTRVYAPAAPDAAGRIAGDLTLYGGGDPSMSNILVPYQKNAPAANPMTAIETFADVISGRGVRSIDGDIVGDDTAYLWEPYPPGWSENDTIWDYGAPVSALTLNHNMFTLTIHPGARAGDPATLSLSPAMEYFTIDNRVRTSAGEQRIHIDRSAGSRELRIWGTVSQRGAGYADTLAVDDPALFAATALYDALIRRGIAVRGRPVARHRVEGEPVVAPAGVLLTERQSPPLIELLEVVDKVSQNLWAELMLREVGRVRRGDGSRRGGLEELKAFLQEIGAPADAFDFHDASGLSRMTLVSPSLTVRLLRSMYASAYRDAWRRLLPIGGEDGTLARRFGKQPAANSIHAKTGSLSHVNALSGYLDSTTYGEVAFSIFVNNTSGPAAAVREFIDKIGLALVE